MIKLGAEKLLPHKNFKGPQIGPYIDLDCLKLLNDYKNVKKLKKEKFTGNEDCIKSEKLFFKIHCAKASMVQVSPVKCQELNWYIVGYK